VQPERREDRPAWDSTDEEGTLERLDGFDSFPFEGKTDYRRGQGPGVIVMHELPGMIPECIELARAIAAAGYAVYLPLFFGRPGQPPAMLGPLARICLSREFTALRRGRSSPITAWLRALARFVREETGGGSVGVIGMCLTGGFALAMLLDEAVAAPVVCQPSLPLVFPWSGPATRSDLGIDPEELARIKDRVARESIPVLGFRFESDPICPRERMVRLRQELGDQFLEHELPGDGHAVLTLHFRRLRPEDQDAVWRTLLGFLNDRLKAGQGLIPPTPAMPRAD
jgi:dienelactone hydrolase